MSVRVSNVARPSSAVASAGAPQYARSIPIATKSVRPAAIAAGMSTSFDGRLAASESTSWGASASTSDVS